MYATQVHGRGYKLVSWNVRGLGHIMKHAKVFAHLKSLSADIMFLKKTHIKHTAKGKLMVSWVNQLHEANFTTKARGVAILIRKNIPCTGWNLELSPNNVSKYICA